MEQQTRRNIFMEHLQVKILQQLDKLNFYSDEELANYIGRIGVNLSEELKNFAKNTDKNGDWHSVEKMAKWLREEI